MAIDMIHFDTLRYIQTLETSGIPKKQAEAMLKAQQESLSECADNSFGLKDDIRKIKQQIIKLDNKVMREIIKLENRVMREIAKLEHKVMSEISSMKTDIKWIKWYLGAMSAGIGSLILKAFF